MNAATHKVEGNAKVPVLYMAPELSISDLADLQSRAINDWADFLAWPK